MNLAKPAVAAFAASGVLAAPTFADEASADEMSTSGDAAAIEALMREYVDLFSAGDARAVAERIYRMDPYDVDAQTLRLEGAMESLHEQGYDHSEESSVEVCLLTDNQALVELRYTRFLTSGEPMPPAERATAYLLRRYDEGWRITNLIGMDASANITCDSRMIPDPAPEG
ncbi:MAG: hypothetical protein PVI23_02840 [Maricaulaceae bacterium]|jgi:hypothetical protein